MFFSLLLQRAFSLLIFLSFVAEDENELRE